MPQLDFSTYTSQIIWLAISFLSLYWLVAKLALPRIGGAIEQRRSRIANDLDQAASLKDDIEKATADYETAIAEARAKANAIAQETEQNLAAEAAKQQAQLDAEIAEKLTMAEAKIADARAKAMTEVQKVAGDLAGDVVTQLTGNKVSSADIANAISDTAG